MYDCEFKWPGGANIAVVFNMSWETWEDTLGTSASHEKKGSGPKPDAPYARGMRVIYEHAYAETGGMQRIMDVWKRHGLKASCYTDGLTATLYPRLAKRMIAEGHELLVQGWTHHTLTQMTLAQQVSSLDRTIEAFDKVLGYKATGFSSPGGNITNETFALLADRGFKYCCGLRNSDLPFIIPVNGRKLVGMTSYDISEFASHTDNMAVSEIMQRLQDCFDAMYEEGERGYPKMLAYGTHPFCCHASRTRPLERVIEHMKTRPKVWFATRGEIADYMLKTYPNHDLSKFYSEAVNSDTQYGLGIGLGGAAAVDKFARYRNQ